MIKSSKLSVSIHDVEFAKDFQYFVEMQYEGVKKQTDLSALTRSPVFTNNTFFFDPPSNHTIRGIIIFVANISLQQNQPTHSKNHSQGKNKILGECTLDLTPFGLQPTQAYNLPIRQQMKFIRVKDGKQISVGRFIVSFKIVPEQDVPNYITQIQEKKIEKNEVYVDLPEYDQNLDFNWRLKIDIREALNLPSIDNMTPQAYVQLGWTQYRDTLPQQKRVFSTTIINSNHPEWNQIFLITNPPHIDSCKGFLMISLKQKNTLQDVIRVYLPLQSMSQFIPYNIKFKDAGQMPSPAYLYTSFVLQAPSKIKREPLHDIIVADIVFQQGIAPFKQLNLALVSDSQNQPKINFLEFSSKQDVIERILEFDQAQQFTYFLSHTMRIPPIKSNRQFRAACIFTIPESFMAKKLSIFLIGKVNKGTYVVAGIVQSIQKDLVNLILQKTKKRLFYSVRPHPNSKLGKCQLQLADKQQSRVQTSSRVNQRATSRQQRGQQTATQRLMHQLNITSNDSLVKHVNQNNEIIVRILRQLDDKSESLRQAASQICDLRSRVKLLQNQNSILRRQALKEEDQLVNLVQREVDNMNQKQLKEKIIKISQLYKSQRIKNKDLEKSIATMEPQISNAMQLNSIIANQKNQIKIQQQKIQKTKKDLERINIYKQTIKKQEKVIVKLERVMKDGMEEVRNARQTKIQLQQLKKKGLSGSSNNHNYSQRQQINRLQSVIAELQRNQKKGVNFSNVSSGSTNNAYELQFKLHQAETRIQSLERQLQERSKSYARQIAMYKMKIAEKQAILDGFSHNQSYN